MFVMGKIVFKVELSVVYKEGLNKRFPFPNPVSLILGLYQKGSYVIARSCKEDHLVTGARVGNEAFASVYNPASLHLFGYRPQLFGVRSRIWLCESECACASQRKELL